MPQFEVRYKSNITIGTQYTTVFASTKEAARNIVERECESIGIEVEVIGVQKQ